MNFLKNLNEKTKGSVGLLVTTAIAVYILTLYFVNTNFVAPQIGIYITLATTILLALIAEYQGAQILAVVLLLFVTGLHDGVYIFYDRITAWGSFEWYHLVNFLISIYLWMKAAALILERRRSITTIKSTWIPLVVVLAIYFYLSGGLAMLIMMLIPVLFGFAYKYERLTLIYVLIMLIRPVYANIYEVINGTLNAQIIVNLAFSFLFGYYIFKLLPQAVDHDNIIN